MPEEIDHSTGGPGVDDPAPGQPASSGRHRWVWVLPIVIVAGVVLFFYSRQATGRSAAKSGRGQGSRAVPIDTATVKQGPIDSYITALGLVTPVYTVTVTSRVQGEIMSVSYTEGQMVHKGQSLIAIDPRPYQAALTQAQGQLEHDEAVVAEARIDLQRYQAAAARNAIATQQLEDQEKVVLQDEGTVKNDQGLVDSAKVNLQYCSITSPIEGRVGLRLVDPGNIVLANSTTGLVVITQLQPITVVLSVAEDDLPQIQDQLRQGHKLAVTAFDRTQQRKIASGALLTLDNVIDATTGTVKLKAVFPNQDAALFPGQFVNARLLVSTQPDATLVPTAAIQRNAQGAFVFVVGADQTAQSQPVTVGTTDAGFAAVSGVTAGQVVAVNGFDKLQDGVKVLTGGARGRSRGDGAGGDAGNGGAGGPAGQKHAHRRHPQPDTENGK
jgi:membrane fusion protein, multidrug efflux system